MYSKLSEKNDHYVESILSNETFLNLERKYIFRIFIRILVVGCLNIYWNKLSKQPYEIDSNIQHLIRNGSNNDVTMGFNDEYTCIFTPMIRIYFQEFVGFICRKSSYYIRSISYTYIFANTNEIDTFAC